MVSTSIKTSHGVYTGKTVESIVRREYGRKAYVQWSSDRNSPEAGLICEPLPPKYGNGANVLARLISTGEDAHFWL